MSYDQWKTTDPRDYEPCDEDGPCDDEPENVNAGYTIYVIRTAILDLVKEFMSDPNERRFISGSKGEIANAISDLSQLYEQIERADTSRSGRIVFGEHGENAT